LVSVVLSTYNWSSALRCALRSVELQTFSEFEVLVIGDGCTDDSELVVRSFGDSRFKWHNLPRNNGSQYAANNRGLELASADWVAYLGQDDIWHPRHLEACLNAGSRNGTDFVASICMMYGPPGSGIRAVTGLFVDDQYSPRAWMPPSSWMHTKSLVEQTGYWKAPDAVRLPVDCAFLTSVIEAGTRIVSTDELTVFKFNAAWRRNSYRLKPVGEQKAVLDQIESGLDFRQNEWRETARAFLAGLHITAEMPEPADGAGLRIHGLNSRHKGAQPRYSAGEVSSARETSRFPIEVQSSTAFFEWHEQETDAFHGSFRWSGPLARSSIAFPIRFDRALALKIHVLSAIEPAAWDSLKIFVQGTRFVHATELTPQGTRIFSGTCNPAPEAIVSEPLEITFEVARTRRPVDLGVNTNDRWRLGVAVNWVEIGPA
jgi:hypothetical protein